MISSTSNPCAALVSLPLTPRVYDVAVVCVALSRAPFAVICLLFVGSVGTQVSILQQPAFCVVRSLIAFRLTSTHKDYCVVGTDAGKVTILEYLPETSEVSRLPLHTRVSYHSYSSFRHKQGQARFSASNFTSR